MQCKHYSPDWYSPESRVINWNWWNLNKERILKKKNEVKSLNLLILYSYGCKMNCGNFVALYINFQKQWTSFFVFMNNSSEMTLKHFALCLVCISLSPKLITIKWIIVVLMTLLFVVAPKCLKYYWLLAHFFFSLFSVLWLSHQEWHEKNSLWNSIAYAG